MLSFVAKRLVIVIAQLILVAIGIFLLLRILPADPVANLVGLNSSKAAYALARHSLGLDHSVGSQLWIYLKNLAHGDFGRSWSSGAPVKTEIIQRFPITLQLIVLAFIVALAVGIPVGRTIGAHPGGVSDKTTMVYSLFAASQPDFWWGLMFLFLFNFVFHIFPAPLGFAQSRSRTPPPQVTHFILIDSSARGVSPTSSGRGALAPRAPRSSPSPSC